MRGLFRLVLALVLWPWPLAADPVQAAFSAWLSGQEEAPLRQLAGAAAGGDAQARVFLALIEADPAYHGPWLTGLPRAERARLLRQGGGLSGRSWMGQADMPVAAAWRQLWSGQAGAEVVGRFLSLGEDRAARLAALRHLSRERRGFEVLAGDGSPPLPEWLMPFVLRDQGAGREARPGDPVADLVLRGHRSDPGPPAFWLEAAALAGPLRSYCRISCADQPAADCRQRLFARIGGVEALFRLGPPLALVATEADFAESPAGLRMIERLAPPPMGSAEALCRPD